MADALHTPGVVSAAEARLDDAGLIAVQGPTALDIRTGVMVGPGTTALVTGTSSTAPMQYAVAAHHWVTNRGVNTDGVYRGTNEAVQLVNTTAAPGSGSRIDVIYEKQNDANSTITPDGATAPVYGVVQGTATTGTPTKPAIPVGALELGTATVAAGATATNGSGVVITNTARQTVARGARIPVRNQADRDALAAFPGLEVYRLDTGNVELYSISGAWVAVHDTGAWTDWSATAAAGWSAVSLAPSVGNGSLAAKYRKIGRLVEVDLFLTFGSTSTGGTGAWSFPLPFAAAAGREQYLTAKGFTATAANFVGFALIGSGGSTVSPYLPASGSTSACSQVQNANSSGASGTGIPAISGHFTFESGNNFALFGRYEAAA